MLRSTRAGARRRRRCLRRRRARCCRYAVPIAPPCSPASPATAWPIAPARSVRPANSCGCGSKSALRSSMRAGSICAAHGRRRRYQMRRLRDDPQCAEEEFAAQLDEADPGLSQQLSFDPQQDIAAPMIARGARPRSSGAARAGRQQPVRDGGGARSRRLRGARRAHDGSAGWRVRPGGVFRAGGLRRILLR